MTRFRSLVPIALCLTACSTAEADAPAAAMAESAYAPDAALRAEILAPLQSLFDALESGDADLLRSVVVPGTTMHFTEEDAAGNVSSGSSTVDALAERISGGGSIERMWDAEVRVDGTLATIWTKYDFYNGVDFSHCGVDVATLVRGDDGWKIVGLSWTRQQPPACSLHPDGPPSG